MRPLPIHPLGAAIMLTVLAMGVLGFAVVLPIAFIQWAWNWVSAVHLAALVIPPINVWQAALLYLAGGTALYLTGWVQIDISMDSAD
jgi:hypothetical protein